MRAKLNQRNVHFIPGSKSVMQGVPEQALHPPMGRSILPNHLVIATSTLLYGVVFLQLLLGLLDWLKKRWNSSRRRWRRNPAGNIPKSGRSPFLTGSAVG